MTAEPLPNRNDVDRAWDGVDEIVEAYVSGRLIDSQAIRDAWDNTDVIAKRHCQIVSPRLVEAIEDTLTEDNNDG